VILKGQESIQELSFLAIDLNKLAPETGSLLEMDKSSTIVRLPSSQERKQTQKNPFDASSRREKQLA